MQLLELNLDHLNFYCPVTGTTMRTADHFNADAPALMGFWVDEILDNPVIKHAELQASFEAFLSQEEAQDPCFRLEFDDLESFLKAFDAPNWVAYCITNCGFGCGGPISSTVYMVIDMNTIIEEDES